MDWVESIRAVPEAEWARVATPNFYTSYAWLKVLEGEGAYRTRYLLARDAAGQLVGALPTYLSSRPSGLFDEGYLNYPDWYHLAPSDRDAWFPMLLGGGSKSCHNELLLSPALDAPGRARVLGELLAGFTERSQEVGAGSAALLYLTTDALREVRPFLGGGTGTTLASGRCVLSLEGLNDFEGYLARLPSSARAQVRQDLNRFQKSGLTVKRLPLADCYPKLTRLLLNVMRKHGEVGENEEGVTAYLKSCAQLGAQCVAIVCEGPEGLVGCSVVFLAKDALHVRSVGFDYDLRADSRAYFKMLFYAPIELGLERGAARIDFGVGSQQAKTRRGATVAPHWSVVLPPAAAGPQWRAGLAEWGRVLFDRINAQVEPQLGPLPRGDWTCAEDGPAV